MLTLLPLVGCPVGPAPTGDTGEARTCDQITTDFEAEAAAIRNCDRPSDCGQVLTGTSCGCTQDWVARDDADVSAFYDLISEAGGTCDLGLTSPCDCPVAYGFDCVENTCQWAYVTRTDPYPDCHAANGDPYVVDALSISGDTLYATVRFSGGCETHDFVTCWPDGAFQESDPVRAQLELWHDAHGDACEAEVTQDVPIDLVPLKTYWQNSYGQASGTIVVQLGAVAQTYTF